MSDLERLVVRLYEARLATKAAKERYVNAEDPPAGATDEECIAVWSNMRNLREERLRLSHKQGVALRAVLIAARRLTEKGGAS